MAVMCVVAAGLGRRPYVLHHTACDMFSEVIVECKTGQGYQRNVCMSGEVASCTITPLNSNVDAVTVTCVGA